MARNVEVKAHVNSAHAAWILYELMPFADRGPVKRVHEDIFFACSNGRLKLRVFADRDNEGELIFYQRADVAVKVSEYVITATSQPDLLCETLTRAYGQVGRVKKTRTLLTLDRTRIHIDEVQGLVGHFIEIEVILSEGETPEMGAIVTKEFIERLHLRPQELVIGAYVDLLAMKPQAQ